MTTRTIPTVTDAGAKILDIGDLVWVGVGNAKTRARPGYVLNITRKNVLVRFCWNNGRITDRRFPTVAEEIPGTVANGIPWTPAVNAAEESERAAWAIAVTASGCNRDAWAAAR